MYVCLCLGVTDRQIRKCLAEGACSQADVTARTGAGSRCGSCRASIAALVESNDGEAASTDSGARTPTAA